MLRVGLDGKLNVDVYEALVFEQPADRLCVVGPHVRGVDVELRKGHERFGIDRLHQKDTGSVEHPAGLTHQANDVDRGEMLDYLGDEDAPDRLLRQTGQIIERVPLLDGQALRTTVLDHAAVEINAACDDVRLAQELEKLAATAAEVDDVTPAGEASNVPLLPLFHARFRAAEGIRERELVEVELPRDKWCDLALEASSCAFDVEQGVGVLA